MSDNAHHNTSVTTPVKPIKGIPRALDQVNFVEIDHASDGQRLDNFLLRVFKGVPKTHVYRLVRDGQVRVNKKRADVKTRLVCGDIVRLPPVRVSQTEHEAPVPKLKENDLPILFEDRDLLIVNKPAGLAAHGGSGVKFGLIERLRASRPEESFLELAHRLDRDTSGALIVCKTRKALVRLHAMQRETGGVEKHYRLLVVGDWVNERQHIRAKLHKYTLASGERRVRVDEENGLSAHTIFTVIERFGDVTLLDAELKTGRTHQIRVHALSAGHPLVGDDKYGDYAQNAAIAQGQLGYPFSRMALHAAQLKFAHPVTGEMLTIDAPMDEAMTTMIRVLSEKKNQKIKQK